MLLNPYRKENWGRKSAVSIVYGGVFPSFSWESILSNEPQIDVIVRGEGEVWPYEIWSFYFRDKHERFGPTLAAFHASSARRLTYLPFPKIITLLARMLRAGEYVGEVQAIANHLEEFACDDPGGTVLPPWDAGDDLDGEGPIRVVVEAL
ncbi:MAG: hypothetical protein HN341_10690 [Verrucomicrobia bacterium]|jgi:hypothetical protein|nr:hypothetical protein [Verrucomicrobiota bacterium]